MKVEVAVLGSLSLIVLELTVKPSELRSCVKVEVTVPYGLCGRKATLNRHRALELCESRGGRPGLPAPNCPDGLCGREATLH